MRNNQNPGTPVSVVERISLVLESFNGTGPLTLAQVTQKTGLPRSSVHRLLEQLTATGWLTRDELTYEHGPKIYETGQAAFQQNRLSQEAQPVMRRLAQSTGFTVHLGSVIRGDVLYLAKVQGRNGAAAARIGARVPSHQAAIGKAILAHYSDDRLPKGRGGQLAQATGRSIRSSAQLIEELDRVRDRGAAFDSQESAEGVSCVAVSLGPPDHYYGNRAALSVCGPSEAMELTKLAAPLRVATREIWERCVTAHLKGESFRDWRPPVHRTA